LALFWVNSILIGYFPSFYFYYINFDLIIYVNFAEVALHQPNVGGRSLLQNLKSEFIVFSNFALFFPFFYSFLSEVECLNMKWMYAYTETIMDPWQIIVEIHKR
jgi:hypothetical protein